MKFYINETADMGYSPYDILLDDTRELVTRADNIQRNKGKPTLFDDAAYERFEEDWYNFYLECNESGVKGMWFEYGSGEYGGEIKLTDQEKEEAFKAVLKFFDGIERYKWYISVYG